MASQATVGSNCASYASPSGEQFYVYVEQKGEVFSDEYLVEHGKLYTFNDVVTKVGTAFTFVVFKINRTGEMIFIAGEARSPLEHQSKHTALMYTFGERNGGLKEDDVEVLYAGEMYRNGGRTLHYNFMSGSYMVDKYAGKSEEEMLEESKPFAEFLKGLPGSEQIEHYRYTHYPSNFIPDSMSKEELDELSSLNVNILLFEKSRAGEKKCKKFGRYPISMEELEDLIKDLELVISKKELPMFELIRKEVIRDNYKKEYDTKLAAVEGAIEYVPTAHGGRRNKRKQKRTTRRKNANKNKQTKKRIRRRNKRRNRRKKTARLSR